MVNEFERGGFAGAAAAKEHESLTTINLERQVVKELQSIFQTIRYILKLNDWAVIGRTVHTDS